MSSECAERMVACQKKVKLARTVGPHCPILMVGIVGLGPDSCGWKSRAQRVLLLFGPPQIEEEIPS
ncbi:hypothetical protein F4776DRAFT_631937 [Hypoxylon sp. NC0597]|nr:hypothetical protein F4776DRAFT_631937 [Hypoxylon sp. NC0597]